MLLRRYWDCSSALACACFRHILCLRPLTSSPTIRDLKFAQHDRAVLLRILPDGLHPQLPRGSSFPNSTGQCAELTHRRGIARCCGVACGGGLPASVALPEASHSGAWARAWAVPVAVFRVFLHSWVPRVTCQVSGEDTASTPSPADNAQRTLSYGYQAIAQFSKWTGE